MNTPILDFVNAYIAQNPVRLHMPGHKGREVLGFEARDITEFDGADVLYAPDGILRESQQNAAALFGAGKTLYSCEGSSLSIRAMLYLALVACDFHSRTVLAARNAHRVFMSAAALLDLDVRWLYPKENDSLLSCTVTAADLEAALDTMPAPPCAVYVTGPDYLGNTVDIAALASVCHRRGVLLLCDNAHGAYRQFSPTSQHPMALGADMCCDSAHKTLPVLTGGGYLHIHRAAPEALFSHAERAMALFASTSPSYLILQSLDAVNAYLDGGYAQALAACVHKVNTAKERLRAHGFSLVGDEELKLTVAPKSYGYTGDELAQRLHAQGLVCEFHDPDYLTCMFTPSATEAIERLTDALLALPRREAITKTPPPLCIPTRRMSAREALFSKAQTVPLADACGKVLACETVSCPPAVPIVTCGEEIDEAAIALMAYYGTADVVVVWRQP